MSQGDFPREEDIVATVTVVLLTGNRTRCIAMDAVRELDPIQRGLLVESMQTATAEVKGQAKRESPYVALGREWAKRWEDLLEREKKGTSGT